MREIVVTYDSVGDAVRALKKMRRFGLRSPLDHILVEATRVFLLIIPMALVAIDIIRMDHAIAAYCGYFALLWFIRLVKPAIIRTFGPHLPAAGLTSELTLTFDAFGIETATEWGFARYKWQAIPAARVFPDGVILRIAPEHSVVIAATHFPEGLSMGAFVKQIESWRAESLQ